MKRVNGQDVPENLSFAELSEMMDSPHMQTFVLACEALRLAGTHEAYELLKKYIASADKYKRRYVLSVIFDFAESSELSSDLLKALKSKEKFLVTTALDHLVNGKIKIADEEIFACLESCRCWLGCYFYQVLDGVEKSKENLERTLNLYRTCGTDSAKIAIAEHLADFCTPENYLQLYDLMAEHPAPKIRMAACRIAKKFGRRDLLQHFEKDPDGHIRKYVSL